MALKSQLLSPPPSGDPRIQLAYNNRNRPIAFGELQSQSVARIQLALVKLNFPMPKSVTPGGADGKFGKETLDTVRKFQASNRLHVDGMVGQHTLDKLDELLLKLPPGPTPPTPPSPPPSTDPKTVAESLKGDPILWISLGALPALNALRLEILSGIKTPLSQKTRQALDHHFHMDNPESNMVELNFINDRYKEILDTITNQSGTVFKSSDDAKARADKAVDKNGNIVAAYTFNKADNRASINFTSRYIARSDDCKKAIIIHESMHFVEPQPGTGLPDIAEWELQYIDRVVLPVARAIHNPSSYAACASELGTGRDRRDFCFPPQYKFP